MFQATGGELPVVLACVGPIHWSGTTQRLDPYCHPDALPYQYNIIAIIYILVADKSFH